jgi:2-methylcitrate dehydratase PrpD
VTASSGGAPALVEALAAHVAGLRFEDLPADVVTMARRVVLDALGCALNGVTTPEARQLAAVRADLASAGPCTVWGTAGHVDAGLAALLNGAHAHMRELDDIGGGGHAGAVQVPAVMCAAEMMRAGVDGADVLVALVAGHEVTSRLTDAASYDTMTLRGWHTTGVYGAFGAAAAAARTMRLDAEATADALGLAGSFVGGIWAFMADGAMSKRLHPGKAAATGVLAAALARRGVTGPRAVLEASWGGVFPTYLPGAADPAAIVKDLGSGYRILRKGFKPFPVCWGIHSAAEAVLETCRAHDLSIDRVAAVTVTLSEMSQRMIGSDSATTTLAAQMSLPWSLAAALVRGRLTLAEFSDDALADTAIRDAMRRIRLVVDPAAHGERQTVQIETTDGARVENRVETPRGHWDRPLSDDELRAKFRSLAAPVLGSAADDAITLVRELERPGALARLLRLLGRDGAARA